MISIAQIAITIVLLVIVYEDFRYRAIHWFLLPLLFAAMLWHVMAGNELLEVTLNFGKNLGLLALQFVGISVWFSLKAKRPVNVINTAIGSGDIWFFPIMALAFSQASFLFFIIAGLTFTLVLYGSFQLIRPTVGKRIPLAGAMAAFFLMMQFSRPESTFYFVEPYLASYGL